MVRHALAAVYVTALLGSATLSASQTVGPATGSVVGTVRDATGAVLPNVAITITGDALMGARVASTREDGNFRVSDLPPGDYTLSFSLHGFNTYQHGVTVALGFTKTVDVQLSMAAGRELMTIVARSRVLDSQGSAIADTFDAGQLADMPGSRSTSALYAAARGVVTTTATEGGSVGAVGGGSKDAYGTRGSNRPTIEGIVVSGIDSGGLTVDYGSFEEASVVTGSHGPEWATHGVHLQLIAKSGGNEYHGTLYTDYENRHWQSFNVDRDQIGRGARSGDGLSAADANRIWQHRDVNADVGGFIVKDKAWWYFSFRDQEMASRMVNFHARPHRTRLTNYSGKGTYRIAPGHTFIAYAQAARNHQPNGLDPFGPAGSGLAAATAIHTNESSTADQHVSGLIWKGAWQAVVHEGLLLEFRLGQFDTGQRWAPYTASPRFEDTQTLVVSGGNRDWQSHLRRDQLFGNASYFKDGWMGSHHLKLGVDATRWLAGETWRAGYPGGVLHVLRNGAPVEVYLFQTPSKSAAGLWTYAAHAADSWQLHRRVALNLGVRFDGYRVFLPTQEHPAGSPSAQRFAAVDNLIDWHVIVPRLGAVFDLTGDGTALAKIAFGQYRVAPGNAVGARANPNSNQWWTRFDWRDLNNSGVWESGEEVPPARERRGGTAAESLDPALRLPLVNEFAGWLEHELPTGVGLRTGFVWRSEHDHFARQNANQPFEAFTVPVSLRDPGPDGIAGTADDGRILAGYDLAPEFLDSASVPVNIVRNVPGSRSEYWTWEIGATRRLRGRWAFEAGFTHTWNSDQASAYLGQSVRKNAHPLTPNDLINAGPGGRHEFTTWTAKARGTFEAPWRIRVTPMLRHQSGQPFGRTFTERLRYGTVTVLAEPVGTRRTDNITILDLRMEKGFRLAPARRIAAFLDVLNLANANPEQNVIWSSGPSYLRPLDIVPPRIARLGVKLAW